MNILGNIVRLQYKDGTIFKNVPLERSGALTIQTVYVNKAGRNRGIGHARSLRSWSVQVTVLIKTEEDFTFWWNILNETNTRTWRMNTDNSKYRGEAWVSGFAVVGSNEDVIECEISLTGNGKLEKV